MPDDRVDLPAPLVPAQVDLRKFEYMPLDVRRLRDSRFAAASSGDAFRSAVLLWCAAWHELPAGTLPDDDLELAARAGYGRDLRGWRRVRAEALHGFVLCSDGRLHHTHLAEVARDAWEKKLKFQRQTQAASEAKKAAARRNAGRNDDRNDDRNGVRDDDRDGF